MSERPGVYRYMFEDDKRNKRGELVGNQFAPVIPLAIARGFEKRPKALGKYHLLLAHDVHAHEDEYAEVYGNKDADFDIIMDNSLIELGYPMPMKEVLDAAQVVGAKYFILPDHLSDADRTREAIARAMQEYYDLHGFSTQTGMHRKGIPLPMPVVQGRTVTQCVQMLQWLVTHFKYCAIPRVLVEYLGTRAEITMIAANMGFKIHLLGFSENLIDDIACARIPGVMGIDSAVPVRLGLQGTRLSLDNPQNPGPRGNYWDNPFEHNNFDGLHIAAENIMRFREWIAVPYSIRER